jgi:hypothetical protein
MVFGSSTARFRGIERACQPERDARRVRSVEYVAGAERHDRLYRLPVRARAGPRGTSTPGGRRVGHTPSPLSLTRSQCGDLDAESTSSTGAPLSSKKGRGLTIGMC